ncbi:MAG: hypothetical protein AAFR90_09635 [Pseudomonadota bacterium]
MRHALGVLGVLAASVLLLVSAAMNWRFGYHLGTTELDGFIYGSASAAADCMKALVPFFAFAAIRNRMWAQAAASFVVWTVVTVYSLTSALGYAALNRQDTAGTRATQAQAYKDLRSDLERTKKQLSWVPQHRPASVVQSEMGGLELKRQWKWTNGCTSVKGRTNRQFCDTYTGLKAEHASANEAAKLESRIAEISAELEQNAGDAAHSYNDPQAAILAKLAGIFVPGVTVEHIQTGLVMFVALLLEVGSGLGLYIAFSQWRMNDKIKSVPDVQVSKTLTETPVVTKISEPIAALAVEETRGGANDNTYQQKLVAPESDVKRYRNERVEGQSGSSLTATALYEDYCAWCDEQNKEPLALPTFGREFGDLGVQKAKIAGRVRYIGVAFRSGAGIKGDKNVTAPRVQVA